MRQHLRFVLLCLTASLLMLSDNALAEELILPAQSRTVRGVVRADDGQGIPGVSVIVKGTTQGTTTDVDGRYNVTVPDESAVLVFSFVGYATSEVSVGNQTEIDVVMEPELKTLEEIVVIGYGERERKDLTGAISYISSDEIQKQVSMSPEMAMQGRMTGVFVSNPGSSPTARPEIRIRGIGTIGFNDPLYVIDGIPITEGGASQAAASSGANGRRTDLRGPINIFAMINPNDIESISVLKDASSTAIYGVRAANGVILITTKRGQEGAPRVNFTANMGVQNLNKRYDVFGIDDYVAVTREAWANNPSTPPGAPDSFVFDPNHAEYLGNSRDYRKDWIENAFVKNAVIQDYNVSISGGNKVSNYAVGAGYSNQEDVVFSEAFQRYSLSINSDHKIKEWLSVGETFRVVYGKNKSNGPRPGYAVSFVAPWQPFFDPTEPLGYARPGRDVAGTFRANGYGSGTLTQYMAQSELHEDQRDLMRNLGSVYAEVRPLKGLRVRGTYSVDYYTNTRETYIDQRRDLYSHTSGAVNAALGNTYTRRIGENINLVGEFLVGYNRSFGDHNVDVVFNAMDQKTYWNNSQSSIHQGSPLPNWEQRRVEEGWPAQNKGVFYERLIYGLQGYMGRVSYNFSHKYYVDVTLRRDGTSRFAPGNNWGTFPSFAAAWRLSSESFMEGSSFISDLKLRGGWGQIGNQETQEFAYLSLINLNPKAAFGSSPADGPGNGVIGDAATLANFASPDLGWETNTTFNIGFDSEFLAGKVRFSAEYYNRFTDDILQAFPIPAIIGFTGNPPINLAQVRNTGFEFEGSFNQQIGDVSFSAGLNLTTVRNRVLRLYEDVPTGGGSASSPRLEVGLPIGSYFGYKTAGIFQSKAEVDEYLASTADPGYVTLKDAGDVRFVDFAGAPPNGADPSVYQTLGPDGSVNNFDQTYLGKTIPGYYYGINLGATLKQFDLTVFFRGLGDVQKSSTLGLLSLGGAGGNSVTDYRNRWTPENPSRTIPRAIQGDPSGNNRFSDRFVHDAGFFRLQNVQLGYTVPADVLSRLGVSSARVSLTGTNLFVISPFPDLDPENITTPTSYILGLNIGF